MERQGDREMERELACVRACMLLVAGLGLARVCVRGSHLCRLPWQVSTRAHVTPRCAHVGITCSCCLAKVFQLDLEHVRQVVAGQLVQ